MNLISPSLLACDFTRISEEIKKVSNAPWLHFDVMDGHFVPNISIGIPVLEALKKETDKLLDVHLMITDPLEYIVPFSNAGADLICFHVESNGEPLDIIKAIRNENKKVGIALKPAIPASEVIKYLPDIDMVLVMTVEPGFGGQVFMSEMLLKIEEISKASKTLNKSLLLQVDGGINLDTAKQCVLKGANVLVAGSFIFGSNDPFKEVETLSKLSG